MSPEPAPFAALIAAALDAQGAGRFEDAIGACDRLLSRDPAHADAWSAKGRALLALERPAEALRSFDEALVHDPDRVDALVSRGLALRDLNQLPGSVASLKAAVAVSPDDPAVLAQLGVSLLKSGEFEAGFAAHEHRRRLESAPTSFRAPLWLGQREIAGRTLLLHADGGFSDTLQFCRYAEALADLGARVVMQVQPSLKGLLQGLAGTEAVIAAGEPAPAHEFHVPLTSLPLALRTSLDTTPAPRSYLSAPQARLEAWRERVPKTGRVRIGVAWHGDGANPADRNRSMPLAPLLAALPPLAEVYALHEHERAEDAEALIANARVQRFERQIADFADTAALASLMDVVVAVDTSAAHLAAALGRPTWILLPFASDWRWLVGREDSPWYPTARLFRQERAGDWSGVLSRLQDELANACESRVFAR